MGYFLLNQTSLSDFYQFVLRGRAKTIETMLIFMFKIA